MKLVCCLCCYDEDPLRLGSCVHDAADLGCTDIVAVDGPYALYPDETPYSSIDQYDAIQASARTLGLGCLTYQPAQVWGGNEIEKRQAMLDLTLAITTQNDWWILWDADFHLESESVDLKLLLERYMHSGAQLSRWGDVELTDCPEGDVGWYPVRLLYRAIPGMCLHTNHYTYHYPDGESTRMNNPQGEDLDRGLKLQVRIRHLPEVRQPGRRAKQVAYYECRHELEIECE